MPELQTGLVRMPAGIEATDDLIEEFEQGVGIRKSARRPQIGVSESHLSGRRDGWFHFKSQGPVVARDPRSRERA